MYRCTVTISKAPGTNPLGLLKDPRPPDIDDTKIVLQELQVENLHLALSISIRNVLIDAIPITHGVLSAARYVQYVSTTCAKPSGFYVQIRTYIIIVDARTISGPRDQSRLDLSNVLPLCCPRPCDVLAV